MEQGGKGESCRYHRRPVKTKGLVARPAGEQTEQPEAAQIQRQAPGHERHKLRQIDRGAGQGARQQPDQTAALALPAERFGGEAQAPDWQQEPDKKRKDDPV